jgi:hypothetical protein
MISASATSDFIIPRLTIASITLGAVTASPINGCECAERGN